MIHLTEDLPTDMGGALETEAKVKIGSEREIGNLVAKGMGPRNEVDCQVKREIGRALVMGYPYAPSSSCIDGCELKYAI